MIKTDSSSTTTSTYLSDPILFGLCCSFLGVGVTVTVPFYSSITPADIEAESCFHNLKSEDCEVVFSAVVGSCLGSKFPESQQLQLCIALHISFHHDLHRHSLVISFLMCFPLQQPPTMATLVTTPRTIGITLSQSVVMRSEHGLGKIWWRMGLPKRWIFLLDDHNPQYNYIYIHIYTYIYIYVYIYIDWLGSIIPNYSSTKVLNTAQLNYPHYQQKILYKFKWGILME